MIEVLFFSDREVKQKLFARVDHARRPLLVTQTRTDRFSRPVDEREPFASIDRDFGDLVDLVVVADEGSTEGMWRDPVGDLADRFFPHHREAAYAAATGYMLIENGKVRGSVKKAGPPADDLWFIQEALSAALPGVPPPDPARRPGYARRPAHGAGSRSQAREAERESGSGSGERRGARTSASSRRPLEDEPTPRPAPNPLLGDPWALLGIEPGTPLPDAKKAFRALIAQYHPDKVSHLGPEFRELADRKTREILDAWRRIEEGEA